LAFGIQRKLMEFEQQIHLIKFLATFGLRNGNDETFWIHWIPQFKEFIINWLRWKNWILTNQMHGQISFQFFQSQIPSMDSNSIKFYSANQTPPKWNRHELTRTRVKHACYPPTPGNRMEQHLMTEIPSKHKTHSCSILEIGFPFIIFASRST